MIDVQVTRLPHAADLPLPEYQTSGSAGLDLVAALSAGSHLLLEPGSRELVPTGLSIQLPEGFEAQIRPRSGLALRNGVTVLNAPGTIDSDYRGEICVILVNFGREAFKIARGDRIAQMILSPVSRARLVEVQDLERSHRGAGGFGSTGISTSERRP